VSDKEGLLDVDGVKEGSSEKEGFIDDEGRTDGKDVG